MAADDDDSEDEVNGNGATGDDDGYVRYYNIVKLILLLMCSHYIFYRRRLLPPEERTLRGSRWGALASSPPLPPPCRPLAEDQRRWPTKARQAGQGQRQRQRCCSNNVYRGSCRDLLTFKRSNHGLARWRRRGAAACDKGGGARLIPAQPAGAAREDPSTRACTCQTRS